ncbi:membrane protein [Streptomonospora alba]|uniref:Probable membrane transporter protein n=1 Tax=Streptomonospora alba TaxID=183763 RepID=A0A0C2JED9_9ACTN|nr:TSUP family transporter [Streptomonospora alba]KIH99691.1 membrane protein [Streptomonospora alba]
MELDVVFVLMAVAAAAGWLDAVVGGGGLLLLPALMVAAPGTPVATLLGTNKLSSIFGVSSAAVGYARTIKIERRIVVPTACLALGGSALGAGLAGVLSTETLRPIIMTVLLVAMAIVVLRPGLGKLPDPKPLTRGRVIAACAVAGIAVSFYDGLVGPGTGVFLILCFTAVTGLDFVRASASAKVVNVGTNLGALAVFAFNGQVLWLLGAGLAACSILGAQIGARTVLRRGTGFVRTILVVVVLALLVKLGYDQLIS